jgi:hypothetical protein
MKLKFKIKINKKKNKIIIKLLFIIVNHIIYNIHQPKTNLHIIDYYQLLKLDHTLYQSLFFSCILITSSSSTASSKLL